MTDIPPSSDDPRDQAAFWFARLNSGDATEADRRAFEAWRQADPEHDRHYRNLHFFWDAARHVPEARMRAILARAEDEAGGSKTSSHASPAMPPRRPAFSRRQFGLGLAGACSLGLAVAVLRKPWWAAPDHVEELATARGERRTVTLPDGSVVYMNTDSVATVRLYEGRRVVELAAGEALFEVSHDRERPFIVDAGNTEVLVTGTRFNVRRDAGDVRVSVASGSVEVSAGPWWNRATRRLTAGQGVESDAKNPPGEVAAVDVSQVTAWQRGKIVFDNAPLAQVVAEMNRYLPVPASFAAPALAQYRVAGVFSIDDPLAMMNALPAIAPVRVLRTSEGGLQVVAR
ncbi:hypothetical protein CAL29_20730 [Bordetella genomosp. 10]|uniref:Iron dicitrate transport regulator FecR n=1 Tax=Bordetella genomosp. 10 TaxID=1416804 RepID=A0A261RZD8_9BORD|nr:FecR family protein [Bordetella genomosp. 10]OZI30456.1 hypothetical protein CAL29_20730 [Bordetella genomosp. 10]